jgi:methane/ammonia monooxygenase subunit C
MTTRDQPVLAERVGEPTAWLGGWRTCLWGSALVAVVYIGLRIYQGLFALEYGIDAASPEFTRYWMGLFWVELASVGLFGGLWMGWLVASGRRLLAVKADPKEEVYRIAIFWGLVGITSLHLYFMASFNPNNDGAWHQTVVRDTAFTPSHIPMFFYGFPMGVVLVLGTYLYGRYRIPDVYGPGKGFPWSFGLLLAASVTEVIQIAFNEWAHSLWITEEIFAAPFHWPFVFYGWLAAGIFALWGETIIRLYQIEDGLVSTAKAR